MIMRRGRGLFVSPRRVALLHNLITAEAAVVSAVTFNPSAAHQSNGYVNVSARTHTRTHASTRACTRMHAHARTSARYTLKHARTHAHARTATEIHTLTQTRTHTHPNKITTQTHCLGLSYL